jgi:formylglycine-generating enzyme required for sulfatase activity
MHCLLPRLVAVTVLLTAAVGHAAPTVLRVAGLPFVRIPAGRYRPLYRPTRQASSLPVSTFLLMARPVTNEEFLEFVAQDPNYRRDRLPRVFAEPGYLAHWAEATILGEAARPQQPVTHVSWFAARAFCASRGFRLPLEAEWERAAVASPSHESSVRCGRILERKENGLPAIPVNLPDKTWPFALRHSSTISGR